VPPGFFSSLLKLLPKLALDKVTVTAALRLFDPEPEPGETLRTKPGTFTRTILETLRDAGKPLSGLCQSEGARKSWPNNPAKLGQARIPESDGKCSEHRPQTER